ncbi:hypothetical protein GCM10022419_132990 [Nonomuraea rosea]|uniref:Uncharacterized protein n=1 Tax=Nonomuraea rosea TaxID=638574 RepID=A0ABP7A4M7_9ACTN
MYSSPATPSGTGRSPASSTYRRQFAIGRPIGTDSPTSTPARTSNTQQPTTVSVGPYSFTTTDSGDRANHERTSPPGNASPPTTHVRPTSPTTDPASRLRCAGTTLTSPTPGRASASPSSLTTTAAPDTNGTHKLVTVRSKATDVCNGAPSPTP